MFEILGLGFRSCLQPRQSFSQDEGSGFWSPEQIFALLESSTSVTPSAPPVSVSSSKASPAFDPVSLPYERESPCAVRKRRRICCGHVKGLSDNNV